MAIQRNRCYVCDKGVAHGNSRSHANNSVRRTWKPNLQVARIVEGGKVIKIKVCTRCLNAGKIQRAPRGAAAIRGATVDVASPADLVALSDLAFGAFGEVSLLMNNAGIGANPGKPWENLAAWRDLIDVNFWGVVHGVQAFAPRMIASARPGPRPET